MKNIFKSFVFLATCSLILFSCDVEERDYADLQPEGSFLAFTDVQTGFYNLADPSAASVGFTVKSAGDAVSSYKVTKSYNGGAPVDHASLSSAPTDVTITLSEAVEGLGIGVSDLNIGDVITFAFSNVNGVYDSSGKLDVPVSCASEIAGMYNAVSVGTSTDACCPDETTVNLVVELTDLGGGNYTMSDFSGGLYFEWYDIYGITPDASPGDIQDVCNDITLTTMTEPFGETLEGSGSVDPATGVITFTWLSGYGDTGVTTLTPQ